MRRPRFLPPAVALSLLLVACGSGQVASSVTPSATAASVTPSASATPSGARTSPTAAASPTPEGTGPEGRALIALCGAQADLERGNTERAEAAFDDEVHETLHELADALEDVDRHTVSELLRATYEVEAGFARPAVRADPQRRAVAALIDAMREAMTALDLDQPACAA